MFKAINILNKKSSEAAGIWREQPPNPYVDQIFFNSAQSSILFFFINIYFCIEYSATALTKNCSHDVTSVIFTRRLESDN